jgi:hypothetical protein
VKKEKLKEEHSMFRARYLSSLLLAAAIAAPVVATGCGDHYYRAYDPYDHTYHTWGPDEQVYYNQWVVETHHPNRPYKKLNHDDQNAYWQWRHNHGDHDHDHDNDHH